MTTPTPLEPPRLRESERAISAMQAAMHVLFVVLLAVGFARALTRGASPALVIPASLAFVGVYLAGMRIERGSRRRRESGQNVGRGPDARSERLGLIWIVALIAGWGVLLLIATDFVWLAFALYFLVLHVTKRPISFVLVAITLVLSIAALLTSEGTRPGLVIGPIMGMLVALGISWVYSQLRAENEARRALVTELTLSRDDLLAAQEELARTQHEAGVTAERTRLARDIHDTLAQSFSSILLLSRAELLRSPENTVLQQIEGLSASGLAEAREVVHALRPSELAQAPLAQAIERLTVRLAEQTNIDTDFATEGDPVALSTTIDVALLRVTQSALANVRLHSQATRASVTLTYEPHAARLEVIDDGIGFDPHDSRTAPRRDGGFGLAAMNDRLRELGGSLEIESFPGNGTALIAIVPTNPKATP